MTAQVRPLGDDDQDALHRFLSEVPADDRSFFKEDVTDPAVAERWRRDTRSARVVCVDNGGEIVGFAALTPGFARTSHVGDLRVIVAARARGQGLGRDLTRRMLVQAVEQGLRKITLDVAATQVPVIEMFRRLGFEPEALLRDQLCDGSGALQDVVVLAHAVDDTWSGMLSAGTDTALG